MSLDETTPADGDGITTGTKVSELAGAIRQLKIDLNNGGLELISDSTGATKVIINADGSVSIYTGSTERVNVNDDGIDADVNIVSVVNVDTDCDYVDFTGLDGNNEQPYRLYLNLANNTGSGCGYALYVNGDYTQTNYYNQWLTADGTNIIGNRSNDASIFYLLTGYWGFCTVDIIRDTIAPSSGSIRALEKGSRRSGSVTIIDMHEMVSSIKANITSLRVAASVTNGIRTGSKLILTKARK